MHTPQERFELYSCSRTMPHDDDGSIQFDGAPAPAADIWRDSLLRYAGYANEVGESFRYQFPRFVLPSYGIAMLYVLGDAGDKARRAMDEGQRSAAVAYTAADVLLWQTLASVAIPGLFINQVVFWSRKAVAEGTRISARLPPTIATWGPTALGLGVIPFIIHPIDHGVDFLLDNTTRPWASSILGTADDTTAEAEGSSSLSSPSSGDGGGGGEGGDSFAASLGMATLLAAAPVLGSRCVDANGAFVACKRRSGDPEACLRAGADVIGCTAAAVADLTAEGANPQRAPFRAYEACLSKHGGELAKCQREKAALVAVLPEEEGKGKGRMNGRGDSWREGNTEGSLQIAK